MTMFMISKASSVLFRAKLLESLKTLRCECENKGLIESWCFFVGTIITCISIGHFLMNL
jgi:hypothetical protein